MVAGAIRVGQPRFLSNGSLGGIERGELTVEQATREKSAKQSEGTRAGELLKEVAAGATVFRAADGRFALVCL
jgi:hypothetical protein